MEEDKNYSEEENEEQVVEDPETLGYMLIKASANGNLEEVKRLIKKKADTNFTDKRFWTPLMWASSQGHTEIVKLLLEKNGKILEDESPDKAPVQHTPLHWSSFNGHLHVVWVLIKQGFSPSELDRFGNNCVHHAVAGGRKDILETFLAFGVNSDQKNSRSHLPIHLTSDDEIKTMLQEGKKVKKCKKCSVEFDIRSTKHLCQVCKKYFCSRCNLLSWVFIHHDSVEEERPVFRCTNCQTLVDQSEFNIQEAIDMNSYEKLQNLLEKINKDKINIDVKILYKAKQEIERMKFEIDINAFIGTLQYVESYKTIKKSVFLLAQMLEEASKKGIRIDQKIHDKVQKETERLISERNLRHNIDIQSFSNPTPEIVKIMEELVNIATKNEVSSTYILNAKEIIEKMKENIEAHTILRKFLDYPIREYPELVPVDPKKKPNPAEEAKKKKKDKINVPEWANEVPALVRQVESLENILKRANLIDLSHDVVEQAKENIVRMKKEIKFRQMEEEEAKQAADKKLADKNKKK
jgi:Ankyrin repeats (3 copies)